jgi:tetratricopeptide (TPR) repeat protein
MTVTCDICKATSDLEETFFKKRKTFRLKITTYCPVCWQKKRASSISSYFGWGIFLLIGIAFVVQDPQEGWLFLNLFFAGLTTLLMIIPHELGHAFAAKWLGNQVFRIVLGNGRILKTGKMFGFAYEIRQFPFLGLTYCFSKSSRWYRLKRFSIVVAGPVANLCFFLLALRIPQSDNLIHSLTRSPSPVGWLILANGWILAVNLLPYRLNLPDGKIPNDGLSLLMMPFLPKRAIEEILPLYYVFEGFEFLRNQKYAKAKSAYLQGLAQHPEYPLLRNGLGVVQLEMGEVEEARTIFAQLLDQSDATNKLFHALLQNNLAYAHLLVDRQGLLEEADNLSAEAFRSFPWLPSITNTRAIVLVESGELDKGIALLKQAMEESEEFRGKAVNAAYLAIAEARKGKQESAKQYLVMARQFDENCPWIQEAQKELLHMPSHAN